MGLSPMISMNSDIVALYEVLDDKFRDFHDYF